MTFTKEQMNKIAASAHIAGQRDGIAMMFDAVIDSLTKLKPVMIKNIDDMLDKQVSDE